MTQTNSIKILRLGSVIQRTGLPRSTIYAYISQGQFPESVSIGQRSVGWLENEINEWLNEKVKESRA